MIEIQPWGQHSGTCLQGYVDTTYDNLVKVFGEPQEIDSFDGKVRVEWIFKIDGVIVTIYDWKETRPIRTVVDWHIGGKEKEAVFAVQKAFYEKGVPCYARPSRF